MALPTTNLAEHYIAGTGEIATGALLDSAADQSGNGYTATGTTTARPTVATDSQSRPIWRFPNNSSCRLLTDGPAYDARACSIWMVARFNSIGAAPTTMVHLTGYAGGSAIMRAFAANSNAPTLTSPGRISGILVPLNLGLYGVVSGATTCVHHDATRSQSSGIVSIGSGSGGLDIGSTAGSAFGKMDVYEIAAFSAEQSAQDVIDTKAYFVDKYGLATSYPDNLIVFEGDSITQGVGSTNNRHWPFLLAETESIEANWRLVNIGTSGATLATMTTRAGAVDAVFANHAASRKVLATLIGRNDVTDGNGYTDNATLYAALQTYLDARVAATSGLELWQGTPIACSNATIDGRLVTFVASIRDDLRADVTEVAEILDYRALAEFDEQADANNATYFTDGTHLTNAGNELMAGVVSPFLLPPTPSASSSLGFGFGFWD